MATVAQPSSGLFAAVLQAMRSSDPWSQPLASVMSGLTEHLSDRRSRVSARSSRRCPTAAATGP